MASDAMRPSRNGSDRPDGFQLPGAKPAPDAKAERVDHIAQLLAVLAGEVRHPLLRRLLHAAGLNLVSLRPFDLPGYVAHDRHSGGFQSEIFAARHYDDIRRFDQDTPPNAMGWRILPVRAPLRRKRIGSAGT